MQRPKFIIACLLAGFLCIPFSVNAQPQGGFPDNPGRSQGNIPGMQGIDPAIAAQIMAGCPAFNGQLDPAELQSLMQKCPAFNGNLPPDPSNCPAFANPNAPDPSKCPAFAEKKGQNNVLNGFPPQERKLAKKADARMQSVVKNLERNKRSADALIQAAREAGADAAALANLQAMSEAFRQNFMQTVSPEQIIENIFAAPQPQEEAQGFIIVGPDGNQWLVTPGQANPTQIKPEVKPAKPAPAIRDNRPSKDTRIDKRPEPRVSTQQERPLKKAPSAMGNPPAEGLPPYVQQQKPAPAPQGAMPPQGRRGQNMTPPPGMVPPGMTPPPGMVPPGMTPPQGFATPKTINQWPAAPQGPVQSQPEEIIIMEEETVNPMPLWPTKEDLGTKGVLDYLQKRGAMMGSSI